MIQQAIIIALLVLSIWYTYQEGEIFERVGRWLDRTLPESIHPAVFSCNVCMSPWYGSILYVIIWGVNWNWPVVVIAAMGINAALNKLSPEKGCKVK